MSSTISSTLSWCNKGQSVKKIKTVAPACSGGAAWFFVLIACWMISIQNQVYLFKTCLSCSANLDCIEISKVTFQSKQRKKKNHAFDITCFKWIPDKRLLYKITTTYLSIIEGLNFSVPIDTLDKLLPSLIYFVSDKESIKKGIQTSLTIHFFKTCSVFL